MRLNINRKNVLLASILFVLVAAVLTLNQAGLFRNKQTNPPPPKYTKTDLPVDKLPEVFPKGLIQEKDPVILESYEARIEGTNNKASSTQYSIKYLSKNSLETNKQLYIKYLRDNHWHFLNQTFDDNSFYIKLAKNLDTFHISFNESKIVEITMVHLNIEGLTLPGDKPNN